MLTTTSRIARQEGSVYVLSLLVLLILTIIGLSLSLVTQSEMRIAANERLTHEAFYAANSGIDIATAKALVIPDLRSFRLDLAEPAQLANLNIRHRLDVSPFLPILDSPCNLCQINADSPFFKINHAVAAEATRIAWNGQPNNPPADPTPLAQKSLSVMVSFQPWRMNINAAVGAATDPNRGGMKNAF